MKLQKRGTLVAISWEDSVGYKDRWGEIDDFIQDARDKPLDRIVLSVGVVLDHTSSHLLLAGSVHLGRAAEVHCIPTASIRRLDLVEPLHKRK